jgi:LAO/AO transport system kinase
MHAAILHNFWQRCYSPNGVKNNINYFAATFEIQMDISAKPAIDWQFLLGTFRQGDTRALARVITLVENETPGYLQALQELAVNSPVNILGITGPPGAGKSSLVDLLIGRFINEGKKVGVLCVDPASPFHSGALLGDRIRMSQWYNHSQVFIRSLTTRGSLGGLHPKMIEISDLLKAAHFDCILVETVGVGQSEVEIAALADTTVVVFVPESGDEIQVMKAGLMEIADIFVVNKCDRPGADDFVRNLQQLVGKVPVVKTVVTENKGIDELMEKILQQERGPDALSRKTDLLTQKAYQLIVQKRMKDVDKTGLREKIQEAIGRPDFNFYQFVNAF